jgi:hypothetical protein
MTRMLDRLERKDSCGARAAGMTAGKGDPRLNYPKARRLPKLIATYVEVLNRFVTDYQNRSTTTGDTLSRMLVNV